MTQSSKSARTLAVVAASVYGLLFAGAKKR